MIDADLLRAFYIGQCDAMSWVLRDSSLSPVFWKRECTPEALSEQSSRLLSWHALQCLGQNLARVAARARQDQYLQQLRHSAQLLPQAGLSWVALLCRTTRGPCICGCHMSEID